MMFFNQDKYSRLPKREQAIVERQIANYSTNLALHPNSNDIRFFISAYKDSLIENYYSLMELKKNRNRIDEINYRRKTF